MSGHWRFLRQAVDLAAGNVACGGGPFAAVIVRDGQVIATGCNRVAASLDPTAHAEILAIREACRQLGDFQLRGCTLYSSCEPCPMCLGAVYWARLAEVYFACTRSDAAEAGFDDGFIYAELARPAADRRIAMRHLPLTAAVRPFRAWAEWADRTAY
ncbi:MAG: nucleoside deaminase [Methylococcales bacterium]|nr:nucleoside deaminase [Methylococcales bacterium]